MAKKIGKYKVGSKESTLSLADGGTINGAVTISGTATLSGATDLSNASVKLSGITSTSGSAMTADQLYFTSSINFHDYSGSNLQILCKAI